MKNLGIIGLVVALTAGLIGLTFWNEARRSERLSAEAPAIGFAATATEWWDSGEEEHVSGHTLTFSFVDAASQPHTHTMEQITWYDPSASYKICYNPQDATDWKLYRADHVCGS